jgi:hypothetical protein
MVEEAAFMVEEAAFMVEEAAFIVAAVVMAEAAVTVRLTLRNRGGNSFPVNTHHGVPR